MRFKMFRFAACVVLGFAVSSTRAAVLVDLNADGTNRDGTPSHYEAATGLAGGTFGGDSVTHFDLSGPNVPSLAFDQTVDNIRIQANSTVSTLTGQVGLAYSQANVAPDPVPNPDAGPFTSGTPSANPSSISFDSTTLAPKITSAAPFKLTTMSSFTFEGWLKTAATSGVIAGDRHSSTGWNGWYFLLVGSGQLRFYFSTSTAAYIDSTTRVADDNPHHFAAVWDHAAGEMWLYVDGTPEGTASPTVGSYTQSAGFGIGGRATSGDNIFNNNLYRGELDELRFSNVALTPPRFLSVTNFVPDTEPPELVGLSPTNHATGFPPNANLVASFSESVRKNATGSITITNLSDHSTITIPIGDTTQVVVSGANLTINPRDYLDNNTTYAVLIETHALKDLTGNFFAGITNTTTWTFETGELQPATLLHNWTFDADLADAIGGKDATAFGDAGVDTGTNKIGAGSAAFDGDDDYMIAGLPSDFVIGSGTMSVSFWFKMTTAESSDRVLGTGASGDTQDGWMFLLDTTAPDRIGPGMSDGVGRTIQKGNANGASDVGDGNWHLVAAVFDTTTDTVSTHVDSVLESTLAMEILSGGANAAVKNDHPLTFGAQPGSPTSREIHGYLDDVAIWNGFLTQADVDRLWNNGDGQAAAGPPTEGTLLIIR